MGLLKKKNNELQASAAINDDCLIVSLPNAIEPSVWRLELEKAKNAAFEIQSEEEIYSLIIKKTARSKPDTIGQFDDKTDALEVLMIVSDALKTGKSQKTTSKPAEKTKTPEKQSNQLNSQDQSQGNGGVIVLLSTLAVIGLFYYYWNHLMPSTSQIETREITSSNSTAPQNQTGVPMSADDFLQGF